MKLSHQTIELKPIHPFVIARGGYAHEVTKGMWVFPVMARVVASNVGG